MYIFSVNKRYFRRKDYIYDENILIQLSLNY